MPDSNFLKLLRCRIGVLDYPKKKLAKKLGITPTWFSQLIRGEHLMPENLKERLIKELKLEKAIARLSTSANFDFE